MESLNFNSNGPIAETGPFFIKFGGAQGGGIIKKDNTIASLQHTFGPTTTGGGFSSASSGIYGGDSISDEALYLRGVSNGGGIIKKNHGIDISVVGSTTGYLPIVTGNDPTANQNSGTGTGTGTIP